MSSGQPVPVRAKQDAQGNWWVTERVIVHDAEEIIAAHEEIKAQGPGAWTARYHKVYDNNGKLVITKDVAVRYQTLSPEQRVALFGNNPTPSRGPQTFDEILARMEGQAIKRYVYKDDNSIQ